MTKYWFGLIVAWALGAPAQSDVRIDAIDNYLLPEAVEIALAQSAAPDPIGRAASVYVLRRSGYERVRVGTNSFTCVVQRAWSSPLTGAGGANFVDPRLQAPICYNAAASASIFEEYLRRTDLALAGRSFREIRTIVLEEVTTGVLPAPKKPALAYMLSAGQWIGAEVEAWHPHVMWYVPSATLEDVGGSHDINSGLPLAFDFLGTPHATFVMQAKHFVPVRGGGQQ